MEEQLTEQLSAVKAENEQLREKLDKIHAMLTDQVKLMNGAVRNAVCLARMLLWLDSPAFRLLTSSLLCAPPAYSRIAPRTVKRRSATGAWVR